VEREKREKGFGGKEKVWSLITQIPRSGAGKKGSRFMGVHEDRVEA